MVTGSNVWRSQSDCGEMSPQLLECGQLALQINGPGLANQTVQCNVVLPEAPPTHPSLVCGNHVIVVDDNLDCSEYVEVETLNLAGIQGAFNPDHYYMVNDFNGTSNASGFYPPGVTWVTWELYYEPTDELVSTCVQTVEVVLGDLFMICDNQFNDHT